MKRSNSNVRKKNADMRKNHGQRCDTGKRRSEVRKDGKFPVDSIQEKDYNDWKWYAKNEQMLRDAASFSYNRPLGSGIDVSSVFTPTQSFSAAMANSQDGPNVDSFDFVNGASSGEVPGIMTFITALTPGVSKSYRSPINLAAQNVYSYVRYMNSGAANYDPNDLMLYLLALDSTYAAWNFLKRAYGLIQSYSQSNWYMPRALLESQGFDVDDLYQHIADFRLYLNTTAARLMSFCVPANMSLFIRHSWIFSNIWADSADAKAQVYQFIPAYFFKYNETGSKFGGQLLATEWCRWDTASSTFPSHDKPVQPVTFQQIQTYMNALIDALYMSEDIGIISGDILKAYGQGNLFKLTAVTEDYSVQPVYNEEVLNQIHNATILFNTYHSQWFQSAASPIGMFNITQDVDNGLLLWNPDFATTDSSGLSATVSKHGTILNMPWNDVTPANTMVGSRLAVAFEGALDSTTFPGTNDPFKMELESVGTEMILTAYISFYNNNSTPATLLHYGFETISDTFVSFYRINPAVDDMTSAANQASYRQMILQALTNVQERMAVLSLLTNFDWHPLVLPVLQSNVAKAFPENTGGHASYQITLECQFGDMNTWTVIHQSELENLHLTAIMSEFNIPVIGSF